MVMSGSSTDKEEIPLDWSFQNHKEAILSKGRHSGSNFMRAILDNADLTEGDFTKSNFRRASMVEIDLMKSAFDGSDFRGADLRKARLNLSLSLTSPIKNLNLVFFFIKLHKNYLK